MHVCPDLFIIFKWSITYQEANKLPLVHLLLCFINPIMLSGGSVNPMHPGMYRRTQSPEYLRRISRHMTLSSAKYILASLAVCLSFSKPLKKDFKGSPFTASQRKVQNAPGRTETKPKRDSKLLSR